MKTESAYCAFRLGPLRLAIATAEIQEVLAGQEVSRVPAAPASISGLFNLRGQMVTAYDLHQILGIPRSGAMPPYQLVLRGKTLRSLSADQVEEIVAPTTSHLEPAPPTLPPPVLDNLAGALPLPHGLLLVLDTIKLLQPLAIPQGVPYEN